MVLFPYLVLVLVAHAVAWWNDDMDIYRRQSLENECSNLTELELSDKVRKENIHTLALTGCSMDTFAAIDLDAVANISVLQLRGGSLQMLRSEVFVKLPNLQILELPDNIIMDIHSKAFAGLSQLWMLTLNKNLLDLMTKRVFYPLPELRHLDLSDNRLLGLADEAFAGNPKLEVLLLRGNSFLHFMSQVFRYLKNLILLDLRHFTWRDLELKSAQTIRLDAGKLIRLEVLGEVTKLQAPNNKLEHVRLVVKAPVTELNLHGNKLDTQDISELLRGMWRLQLLDISKNLVTELPVFRSRLSGEVHLLPNLRFVNLSSNRLEHLDQDSPLLSPTLTHLDVSYNWIREIRVHTLGMVENLQYLYLQGNFIVRFRADSFYNRQRGLKEVALYDNPFSNDSICMITKSFEEAGVRVLQKNPFCNYSDQEPVKNHSQSTRTLILPLALPSKEPRTSRKWSTWNVLIHLGLLASLSLDVFLFLQLRRSRAQRSWGKKQSSRVMAKFGSIEGSEIII